MATTAGGIPAAKAQLRAQIRAQRAAVAPAELVATAAAIAGIAEPIIAAQPPGARVACYLSGPTEPGTDALVLALLNHGLEVITPRVRAGQLDWAVVNGTSELTTGPFGIREVIGPSVGIDADPLQQACLIFMPALAIDRRGVRLGQGGGYFDRTLALLNDVGTNRPARIGVVNEVEFLDALPEEPHDCRVDLAISGHHLHQIRSNAS